jgi:SPP1 gp7 family putative phage head morphogenesis protein
MGMDAAARQKRRKDNFADPLEVLPYEEAVSFLQTKIPLTKKSYYELDDKLRFRAFTVGRLNDGDAVNRAKGIIMRNMEQGGSISDFYKMTDDELLNGMGFGRGDMSYWETVYRTNEASVYNAGRAMNFEADNPIALELVGIDDMRQTDICDRLTNPPFRRPYNDPVWKSLWPPFHFNCRTTVRGIYDPAELDEYGGAANAYSGEINVKPEKGWGGYPLDKESYWRLTPEMKERAEKYGIDGEIVTAAHKLGMQSYGMELVKGYKTIYESLSGGYVKMAENATQSDREIALAKKAADDSHEIYLLPENYGYKIRNPDAIIDNQVGELKQPKTPTANAINRLIRTSHDQGASTVILEAPDQLPWNVIEKEVRSRMGSVIKSVFVLWNGAFHTIKK